MVNDNYPVIAVVGPTATGKTNRALQIAQEKNASGEVTGVDLISVDSRQVYQGLEILTGADLPEGFEKRQMSVNLWAKNDSLTAVRTRSSTTRSNMRSSFERFFAKYGDYFANHDDSMRLFGVSIIQPGDEWSVAHFQQYARAIMIESWSRKRLPILVGGTGLYHQQLFKQDDRLHAPPNNEVRKKAEQMAVGDLQKWLDEVNPERLAMMNESDRSNNRRLVRAIEISLVENAMSKESIRSGDRKIADERSEQQSWKMLTPILSGQHDEKNVGLKMEDQACNDDMHNRHYLLGSLVSHDWNMEWSKIKPETVFITADLDLIKEKIEKRVKERFENGAIDEVKWLLSLNLFPTLPVMTTLGVPEISSYLKGEILAEECQKLWSLHEFQYAKRQLTWWNV